MHRYIDRLRPSCMRGSSCCCRAMAVATREVFLDKVIRKRCDLEASAAAPGNTQPSVLALMSDKGRLCQARTSWHVGHRCRWSGTRCSQFEAASTQRDRSLSQTKGGSGGATQARVYLRDIVTLFVFRHSNSIQPGALSWQLLTVSLTVDCSHARPWTFSHATIKVPRLYHSFTSCAALLNCMLPWQCKGGAGSPRLNHGARANLSRSSERIGARDAVLVPRAWREGLADNQRLGTVRSGATCVATLT
jgi:hypothetical protein